MFQHISLAARRAVRVGLAACLTTLAGTAAAADYPKQPISIIVPFGAGGATDITARLLADKLKSKLGQTAIVENRAGAGGAIGTVGVVNSRPDGYTMLLHTGGIVLTPLVSKTPQYDLLTQLRPVARITSVPMAVYVNSASPYQTLEDLIAAGKLRGLTYGSSGIGTLNHVGGAWLTGLAGVKGVHVPYRGGAAAAQAVAAGEIDFSMEPLSSIRGLVESGRLRVIAATARSNLADFRNVPVAADAGLPGFDIASWAGLYVPAATPDEVVGVIEQAVGEIVNEPAFKERVLGLGNEVNFLGSADTRALVERDQTFYGKVIQANHIVAD